MKKSNFLSFDTIRIVLIGMCLCRAWTGKASLTLGAAGPQNWAVLETANGNVNIANASNAGGIDGNVGIGNGGSVGDSGTPINGNVVTYNNTSGNPPLNPNVAANVSGSIVQNSALVQSAITAANNAATAAAGLTASGGGIGYSSINLANNITLNLSPGVYTLSTFALANGDVINLAAGGSYVFNISGGLSLNSAQILAGSGLSAADVIFNIIGSHAVQMSGGLNHESVIDGVILAPDANVQVTPGVVNGEIISGENISIASGASVAGNVSPVPEASTVFNGMVLLVSLAGCGASSLARRLQS